jgi:hypothetical protein
MLRYRLRTLLILLAILPPLLWIGWTKYEPWRAEQAARERQRAVIRLWLVLDGTSMPPPAALRLTPAAPKPDVVQPPKSVSDLPPVVRTPDDPQ